MITLLTINIGAAALERAHALLDWVKQRDDHVIIFSETSAGDGTTFLLDRFRAAGWEVHHPTDRSDRGVAIVSRIPLASSRIDVSRVSIAARVGAIALESDPVIDVVGLYVPSRDRSEAKVKRKTDFIRSVSDILVRNEMAMTVLVGDYNAIERNHIPKHSGFFPFEYEFLDLLEARGLVNAGRWCNSDAQFHSWIGRFGDGYCYDYFHAPPELLKLGASCSYLHETRELGLTDHAAVELRLDGVCAEALQVDLLTNADQASLF